MVTTKGKFGVFARVKKIGWSIKKKKKPKIVLELPYPQSEFLPGSSYLTERMLDEKWYPSCNVAAGYLWLFSAAEKLVFNMNEDSDQ